MASELKELAGWAMLWNKMLRSRNDPINKTAFERISFMAAKLAYQSSKWEKERQNNEKRYKECNGKYAAQTNMESVIKRGLAKSADSRDYVRYYSLFSLSYKILAGRTYLRNNSDSQVIHYTYLSGIAAIFAYLFDIAHPAVNRDKTDQEDMVRDFSYGLLQLFAVQNYLPQYLNSLEHPYVQMLLGNFEKAVELLPTTLSEYDAAQPYAVLMSDAERLTVQAMAEKDEKALNHQLVQHIKNERKWPVGYSVFVDAYSIAYIKLARLNNMNCGLDVIEVPKMFFDDAACKIDISEIKLPFFDDAVEQLEKSGIFWS